MTVSVVDLVTKRRVFARFVASASASAAKAVADGQPVAIWNSGRLHRQYLDGRHERIEPEVHDEAAERP
jgi:hypothetical protein